MKHAPERRLGFETEARRSKITTVTYSMPIYWASYLINGDASGIDDDEIAEADATSRTTISNTVAPGAPRTPVHQKSSN